MGRFLFSPPHLAILAATGVAMAAAIIAARRHPAVRIALGLALAANEIVWYCFRYSTEGNRFPEGLPLQLCDVTLWTTVIASLTLRQWAVEFSYFAGLAGAGMAILTPDLWTPWPSYPAIYYFLAHGLIIVSMVTLLGAGMARPRPGCLRRAFLVTNAYALAVGVFNWALGTNYMYLCRKPASATLLDWLGPWPLYIVTGEAVAFAAFALLWLPWKGK
ncbi:MAG: TIGR02206 family membrane protein [Bryobacteraceae bacterium]